MPSENPRVPLFEYFRELASSQGTSGAIGETIAWLAADDRPLAGFEGLTQKHGVRQELWFRKQITDLVLDYIARVRSERPLSESQLFEVELLKDALHVHEGELLEYRPAEIAAILNEEVEIALADGLLDEQEELHLVRLQIALDLGYDDFLRLCRGSLERGIQALNDEAISRADAGCPADLEIKIASLTPLASLAKMQRRSPGALY